MGTGIFNMGLINYIEGIAVCCHVKQRFDELFARSLWRVYPCNGLKPSIGKRAWETFDRRTPFRIFGIANKPNMCVV